MDWWVYAVGAVVLFAFFYIRRSGPSGAVKTVAQAINVKPNFVMDMVLAMGAERGPQFCSVVDRGGMESLQIGATTFLVYQVLRNPHPSNVRFWHEKISEHGFDADLDHAAVETAFMFLRDAGADITRTGQFLSDYSMALQA